MEHHRDSDLFSYSETYLFRYRLHPKEGSTCNIEKDKRVFIGNNNSTSLVDIEVCSKDTTNQSEAKHNKENNQTSIVEIIVDTVDSTKSGLFWLGVGENLDNRDENSLLMSWSYFIPISVVEKPKQKPI